jgi:hypothetical protein
MLVYPWIDEGRDRVRFGLCNTLFLISADSYHVWVAWLRET